MTLSIEHSDLEGTVLYGSSRGDGSAEVVKPLGWRWSRNVGGWYIQRSRNTPPKRALIQRTAEALQAAGFEVETTIDTTVADQAEAERLRDERSQERAERYRVRADRLQEQSDDAYARGERISDGIPFGQPILVGHHSQRRAERDRDKIIKSVETSWKLQQEADQKRSRAEAAERASTHRHTPVTVANRIDRLEAEQRGDQRAIDNLTNAGRLDTSYAITVKERFDHRAAEIAHWKSVREEQIASGTATNFGKDSVHKGDYVEIRGRWCVVVRANAKTVSVATGYSWTDRVPWQEVTAVKTLDAKDKSAPGRDTDGATSPAVTTEPEPASAPESASAPTQTPEQTPEQMPVITPVPVPRQDPPVQDLLF